MKSAYELAMERLNRQAPVAKLTEEQKAQLAEVDNLFRAKIAEREVFLQGQIAKARAAGNAAEASELEQELSRDVRRLQAECESRKDKLRATQ